MENVSQVFGGVLEAPSDSNVMHYLNCLNEHQSLWKESHLDIEGIFVKIGSLLEVASTRDRGLLLLAHLISQAPLVIVEEKFLYYTNVFAKVYNKQGSSPSSALVNDAFNQLLLKSLDSAELSKLVVGSLPKLLETLNAAGDPTVQESTLRLLATAMKHYAGVCGSVKKQIEAVLYALIDTSDPRVLDWTGKCLLLLQQIKGGGQHGNLHKKTWDEYCSKLINTIHVLLNKVFEHTAELYEGSDDLECLKLSEFDENVGPVEAARLLASRVVNLITFLEHAIVGPYPVAKPLKPMKVLTLISRGLVVTCATMGKQSILENIAMGVFLPRIQQTLLKVQDALVTVLGKNLLPFGNIICDNLEKSLKNTLNTVVPPDGKQKCYTSLRIKIYGSIRLWCDNMGHGSTIEDVSDALFEHIIRDMTPFESEVTLKMNAGSQKRLSAKAKRKLQKQQNAASALTQAHSNDPYEGSMLKQPNVDRGNEPLCQAALECLAAVLQAGGCFIKPVMQLLLQEKIVALCFSIVTQRHRSHLYGHSGARKALLSALMALIVNPHHHCPPPLQYGALVFNVAKISDPNADVRALANELARTVELMVHPRKEVFYFPTQEAAFKDLMASRAKHPLAKTATVSPPKRINVSIAEDVPTVVETRQTPTDAVEPAEIANGTANMVIESDAEIDESLVVSSQSTMSDDVAVDEEPIAIAEDISLVEEQVLDLVAEPCSGTDITDYNAGELHDSEKDETNSSSRAAITIEDSDDESSVQEVPLTDNTEKLGVPERPSDKKQTEKHSLTSSANEESEVPSKKAKVGETEEQDVDARVNNLFAEFVADTVDNEQ